VWLVLPLVAILLVLSTHALDHGVSHHSLMAPATPGASAGAGHAGDRGSTNGGPTTASLTVTACAFVVLAASTRAPRRRDSRRLRPVADVGIAPQVCAGPEPPVPRLLLVS